VNSPRQMRRHARRIRRGGMQPMMLIHGNDQLPETAALVALRSGAGVAGRRTGPESTLTLPICRASSDF
jgi:hypothetical protein